MRRAAFAAAAIFAAFALTASAADAKLYTFAYDSFDGSLKASGEFDVGAAGEVTQISGAVTGLVNDTIAGIVANPNFPNTAYSPDGSFYYDNLFVGAPQFLDAGGVLFTTASGGGYWNLWGNSPTDYSLWQSAGSYNWPIQTSGTLSVSAIPEASTWLMMALGFAALVAVARPRRNPIAALAE